MSDSARLELEAFQELEALVRRQSDELAAFRRRALAAEARLTSLAGPGDVESSPRLGERVAELERENAKLRGRLEAATARTRGMLERVHFLRQQVQGDGSGR
jgi:hypothetical protein